MISAGTRASEHPSTIAKGSWAWVSSSRAEASTSGPRLRTRATKRRLPSLRRFSASGAGIMRLSVSRYLCRRKGNTPRRVINRTGGGGRDGAGHGKSVLVRHGRTGVAEGVLGRLARRLKGGIGSDLADLGRRLRSSVVEAAEWRRSDPSPQ